MPRTAEYYREYRKRFPQKNKEKRKRYYKKHKKVEQARGRERSKRYYAANAKEECKRRKEYDRTEKGRHSMLKREYGITIQVYNHALDSQHFVCAICETPEFERGRFLVVDHEHKTGQIRGLLCGNCNSGLGMFGDDPTRTERATRYLYHYQKIARGEKD